MKKVIKRIRLDFGIEILVLNDDEIIVDSSGLELLSKEDVKELIEELQKLI